MWTQEPSLRTPASPRVRELVRVGLSTHRSQDLSKGSFPHLGASGEPFSSAYCSDSSACMLSHATVSQEPSTSSSPSPCADHSYYLSITLHYTFPRRPQIPTLSSAAVPLGTPAACYCPLAWLFFIAIAINLLATVACPGLACPPLPPTSSRAAGLACFTCSSQTSSKDQKLWHAP